MEFDHDTALCLEELVDLVNSDDARTGADHLVTTDELEGWVTSHRISGSRTGADAELRAMRRLRSRMRELFDLARDGEREAVVARLNELISEAGALPQLVEHDDLPLHLHYTPAHAPLHHRCGAEMAVAVAVVVRDGGLERLRVCESPDCGRVFIDLSRNRSRRYCDTQCGNRQHVAAYRDRRDRRQGAESEAG